MKQLSIYFFLMILLIRGIGFCTDTDGQHDMLLLLPNGPVHLRFWIVDQGAPLRIARENYLAKLVAKLDVDQDGELSREETGKHPLFNGSRRFEDNAFLKSLRSRRTMSLRDISMQVERTAGQLVSYRQNNALADQDLNVFRTLDKDQSGLIDAAEMRLAPAHIAERDTDFDQCVTFDEFLNEAPEIMNGVMVNTLNTEPPGTVHSELLRDAAEPVLAARLVRRYDQDRDAHLTASEIGWETTRITSLDQDADGKLSMQELASIATAKPDVAIQVDIHESAQGAMKLIGTEDESVAVVRPDLIRLGREEQTMTISYRFRDPMAEAKSNASVAFNAIDSDANGYLDRDEIAEHQRFERYLFEAMDRDDDDRVFVEEMLSYVKEYAEPATTTCQVTLLDTGNGIFQVLDSNGDGRISIRELRKCETKLIALADDKGQVNPSRMSKSYRIEIQRGGVSLFGRVDRPAAEAPAAILKASNGPVWFQRMDRNGDGDLTWDEFLGPRDVFHRMDRDQDALIDEKEAAQGG